MREKLDAPVGIHEAGADALREGRDPPLHPCTGVGRIHASHRGPFLPEEIWKAVEKGCS